MYGFGCDCDVFGGVDFVECDFGGVDDGMVGFE